MSQVLKILSVLLVAITVGACASSAERSTASEEQSSYKPMRQDQRSHY